MARALPFLADVLLALAGIAVSLWALPRPEAGFAAGLAVIVTVVVAVDRRLFIIPDSANVALALGGLALALVDLPSADWPSALAEALARGGAAGLLFWGLRSLHQRWRGVEGLGLGDVKLAAAGAPWLAWGSLVPALELAVVGALVAVLIEWRARRATPRFDDQVPFGVFLAPALWIAFIAERCGVIDRILPFAGP